MNAPVQLDFNFRKTPASLFLASTALGWQARVLGAFLAEQMQLADDETRGTRRGDVWWSSAAISRVLAFGRCTTFRALEELERHGLIVDAGRYVRGVPVRNVRPQLVAALEPQRRRRRVVDTPTVSNSRPPSQIGEGLQFETPVSNSRCDPVSNSRCDPVSNSRPGIEELNSSIEIETPRSAEKHAESSGGGVKEPSKGSRTGPDSQPAGPGAAIAPDVHSEGAEPAASNTGALTWPAWAAELAGDPKLAGAWPGSTVDQRRELLLEMGGARQREGRGKGRRYADEAQARGRLRLWARDRLDEAHRRETTKRSAEPITALPVHRRMPGVEDLTEHDLDAFNQGLEMFKAAATTANANARRGAA